MLGDRTCLMRRGFDGSETRCVSHKFKGNKSCECAAVSQGKVSGALRKDRSLRLSYFAVDFA